MKALLLFITGAVLASLCMGQLASTTSIVGTVTDTAGAVVGDAAVTAINQDTQETLTARTNAEGYYSFQFIKIGTYTVSVTHPGFETVRKTSIQVETNQTVRIDFNLRVGQVSERVEVTAEIPAIKTDDAAINEVIGTRATVDLPIVNRDSLRLAITVPTVLPGLKSPSGNPGGGEGFIGAGTREIQNSVSLDGISIMNNLITTTTMRPSVDAVQETQIQTGTYPAQYGGYMGVQVNLITKSGNNALHGTLFEFLRNDALDARGYFEDSRKPKAPFRQNEYGFEVAGPIFIPKLYDGRNKTFFMASWQALRNRQTLAQLDTVLTPLMRQGNFSELLPGTVIKDPFSPTNAAFAGNIVPANRLSSQALKALKYMPLPNADGLRNNYLASVQNANDTDQHLDRLDHTVNQNIRLFFRIAWENETLLNGNTNPNNGYNQPVTDRNFLVGYTHVIRPTIVNDLRFGRQHTTIDSVNFFATSELASAGTDLGIPGITTDIKNSGLPSLGITGFMAIGGQNMASSNWYQTDTTWHASDVLSVNRGSHSIGAGAEVRKLITLRTANNAPRGSFTFSGTLSGNAAADFMLGAVQTDTTPGPPFPGGAAQYRDGFFVTDKWQATSRLTLNLGLRYELPTVPESTNGNATFLDPAQTKFIPEKVPMKLPFISPIRNNWAPRVGFAYRLGDRLVFRGGYGIYYNSNQLNTYTLLTTNPPFSIIYTYNWNAATPVTLSNPTPAEAQGALPKPNAVTPAWYLPTAYMNQWSFSMERALWRNAGMEVQYLGSHSLHLDRSYYNNQPLPGPGNVDARRPNQLFRQIRTIQNDEIANYEGLSVVLRQRYVAGLTSLISYTWSHTLDITTDSNGGGAPMNPYSWRTDYGNANWDLRHRFVASYTYELPFLRKTGGPVRWVLGDWQVNGITIVQSGFPFNITVPGDPANIGLSGSQRPNIVGTPTENCGRGHLTNCIDPTAFAVPANFTFGNAGRNIFRGPGLVDFDFSLFKNFTIREKARFQIRGEFFNIFNQPSFSNPGTTLGSATFGVISGTSNNQRQVQVAAKFIF